MNIVLKPTEGILKNISSEILCSEWCEIKPGLSKNDIKIKKQNSEFFYVGNLF